MTLLMMLMFTMTAQAGKLHDGFMGVKYGLASAIAEPPHADCRPSPESMVAWECNVAIGEAQATAAYMAQDGVFFAVILNTEGYSNASALRSTLKAAYGKGRRANQYESGPMAEWNWTDGQASGTWTYNEYSDKGQFMVLRSDLYEKVKAKADAKATKAASGL